MIMEIHSIFTKKNKLKLDIKLNKPKIKKTLIGNNKLAIQA